jgi:hypothetical protein
MFVKKPGMELKSILNTLAGTTDNPTFPTDLSILREERYGLFLTTPLEVIKQLNQMKKIALSPDPTLPPGAPFPWLGHV